ncbi:MAG: hypothetical protein M3R24_15865 [Chloroflexota bacterium]|nr:hypothetical protein [Chloroflexota bacterium]
MHPLVGPHVRQLISQVVDVLRVGGALILWASVVAAGAIPPTVSDQSGDRSDWLAVLERALPLDLEP